MEKLLPAEIARMIPDQDDAPLLPRFFTACVLPRATILDEDLGHGAPIDQRPRSTGVGQYLVKAMPTRQAPDDLVPRGAGVDLGEQEVGITVPQRRLARTAQGAKLREDASNRGLDLTVSTLFDPVVFGPNKPDRDCPHSMPTANLLFKRCAGALTQQAQLIFRHRSFHPKQ
jgi:hypothetical protein